MGLRDPGSGIPPNSGGSRSPAGASNVGVMGRYNNIIKSQEDKSSYRGLILSNRMKVLLVSDPKTEKSAAALDVNVGYLSDPDELPGLAHFCEHMLFLGTEKYPQENEYSKFLSEHGGGSNASTAMDHTTYYFDVLPPHLGRALDIFAQFFIRPLFTESATSRELNAVNSEHEKNTTSNYWRLEQVNCALADPRHPYSKFGTGNKETLDIIPKSKGINVRDELLKFHERWYSSNIMTLAVLGKESLDELEALVVPLFGPVLDRDVTAPSWPEHPFPPSRRRTRVHCVPVKDTRSLSISFPSPDMRRYYKSGPARYVSHTVGHEGPGSLLAALKARGWCNNLSADPTGGARGFGFFDVLVDLTEEGIDHVDDIITLLFQYLAMLRAQGPQQWVWEEQRELSAISFRFQDKYEPRHFVKGHVSLLQDYPIEDVLSVYDLMTEWRPDLIEELLDCLTPENIRVAVMAKRFEEKCTQIEPWYGTKYLRETIEDAKIKTWRSATPTQELHLPSVNEYIPTRLEVLESEEESTTAAPTAPTIIKDTSLVRLWYKLDGEFRLPKATMRFSYVSPLPNSDPLCYNLCTVWVMLVRDALQQSTYSASLAGLSWSLGSEVNGITITINGYDDKQHVLLDTISGMLSAMPDPQRFEIIKEIFVRAMKNYETEQPYQHALLEQTMCLTDVCWTRPQLLAAAQVMTVDQLEDFISRMLRKVHIEGLIIGNVTKERALEMADGLEAKLPKDGTPLLAQQLLQRREVEIEKGAWYCSEIENRIHRSSCTSVYYSCGLRASRSNVLLELLEQALSEPCFHVLRTQEQLGYIVVSGVRRANGVQGLRVIVQGDKHPRYLETRIEAFIGNAQEYLENMKNEEFLKFRSALAARKLEKAKHIGERATRFWSEIATQMYNFDRATIEVEQLNAVTQQDLIEYYKKHISPKSDERRKLSVHVVSTAEGGAGRLTPDNDTVIDTRSDRQPIIVTDIVEFKSRRGLYPHPVPFMSVPRKGAHCKL